MERKCIVCNREFQVFDKEKKKHKGGGMRFKSKRRFQAITCSPECSKVWERSYARKKFKKELKELKETFSKVKKIGFKGVEIKLINKALDNFAKKVGAYI